MTMVPDPSHNEPEPVPADVVDAARDGDLGSFEKLYRCHVGRIYAICLRMVAEPVQAEILTQDVFVRAWRKLGTYSGTGSFGAWLRRLAVNVVIEDRRAASRRRKLIEPYRDLAETPGEDGGRELGLPAGSTPDDRSSPARASELAIDLERAVAALPDGARIAFVLHDVEGYRHEEIAAMTGLAVGTSKAQLHRARMLLRRMLADDKKVGGA
jgi:RNA polymerase sigma-70 factor (ECF subfamily)